MGFHRFVENVSQTGLESSVQTALQPAAFMACPIALFAAPAGLQGTWQQGIYQLAFEQAQAAARRPNIFERDWLGTWN
jgi:hypothetical protein